MLKPRLACGGLCSSIRDPTTLKYWRPDSERDAVF